MTDDDLRDRLTDVVQRAFRWRQDADTAAAAIMPLVRAEIAAAERRGAERVAQAVDRRRDYVKRCRDDSPTPEPFEPICVELDLVATLAHAAVKAH